MSDSSRKGMWNGNKVVKYLVQSFLSYLGHLLDFAKYALVTKLKMGYS